MDFDEDVDLVGVTGMTCQAPRAYQIAAEFRKRGRKTIMGGIHATARPEEALGHFDSVLVGEAEDIWTRVVDDLRNGGLKRIYRAAQKPDLSRLTIPRYDLMNYDDYVMPPFARTPLISIQASRGCPHKCDFCSVTEFWGGRIRAKPVAHVVREIEAIRPSRVFFSDDNIGANPKYAEELFGAVKPLKLRWACQMSTIMARHPRLIDMAGAAGCHETLIGIESTDEDSLKSVNKSFNKTTEYKDLFSRFKDAGILAQASLIFGLDGDTPDSLRRMIDTLLEWDINYIYIAVLTPFPGTPLYKKLEAQNRIPVRDWSAYHLTNVVFNPKHMTPEELNQIVWEAYEKCYSAGNIIKRTWRFRRQYLRYFPRDNVVEEVFFQFCTRKSIRERCHPYTLGLEMKGASDG